MHSIDSQTFAIDVTRDEDFSFEWTIKDSAGLPRDVSAATFTFTVKKSPDDPQSSAKFVLVSPASGGIDMTDAAIGKVIVNGTKANLSGLTGDHVYDLQMVLAGITTKFPRIGPALFRVHKGVTTAGSAPPSFLTIEPLEVWPFFFEGIVSDGDFLGKKLNINRSGQTAEIVHVHFEADGAPTGGTAVVALQDDDVSPSLIVNLNIPSGTTNMDFDVDASVAGATIIPLFSLATISGKKLSVKVPTARGMERVRIWAGVRRA